MNYMVGKGVEAYTFKKSKQAVTLGLRSAIKINGESVQVDPQLLFQRLFTVGNRFDGPSSLFRYELCSIPSALFETLRHAN